MFLGDRGVQPQGSGPGWGPGLPGQNELVVPLRPDGEALSASLIVSVLRFLATGCSPDEIVDDEPWERLTQADWDTLWTQSEAESEAESDADAEVTASSSPSPSPPSSSPSSSSPSSPSSSSSLASHPSSSPSSPSSSLALAPVGVDIGCAAVDSYADADADGGLVPDGGSGHGVVVHGDLGGREWGELVDELIGQAGPDLAPGEVLRLALGWDAGAAEWDDTVRLAGLLSRVVSWVQAMQARLVVDGHQRAGLRLRRHVPAVFGLAAGVSTQSARFTVERALCVSLSPDLGKAFASGLVSQRKIDVLIEGVSGLSLADEHKVLDQIVPLAPLVSPPQLKRRIQTLAAGLNPVVEEVKAKQEYARRGVWIDPAGHGMADFIARLPAPDAVRLLGVVKDHARHIHAPGSGKTLLQRRADTLSDLAVRLASVAGCALPGCPSGGESVGAGRTRTRETVVSVVVPAGTLLGVDARGAFLHGYGPIPASLARRVAQDATWRAIFTDPANGQVSGIGRQAWRAGATAKSTVNSGRITGGIGRQAGQAGVAVGSVVSSGRTIGGVGRRTGQAGVATPGSPPPLAQTLVPARTGPPEIPEQSNRVPADTLAPGQVFPRSSGLDGRLPIRSDPGTLRRRAAKPAGQRERRRRRLQPLLALSGQAQDGLVSGSQAQGGLVSGGQVQDGLVSSGQVSSGPGDARTPGGWLSVLSSDRHDPSERIRELVVVRNPWCVFPGCTVASRVCDLDHIVPFTSARPARQQTTPRNLAPLCRVHHQLKTYLDWTYTQNRSGDYLWTDHRGRTHMAPSIPPF